MLYLYAITDDPCVSLSAPRGFDDGPGYGFGDQPPGVFDIGGLGVVAGVIGAAPACDAAGVRRHLAVLEALMERCAVLPVRFGSTYSGPEELAAYISDSQEALEAGLARVRGHVEIGVRAIDARPPHPAPEPGQVTGAASETGPELGPGASYLAVKQAEAERNARRKREIEALAETVVGRLAPLASSHSWKTAPSMSGRPEISSAFLVKRERFEVFREALAELRGAEPGLEFLCTGPWPPYSFAAGA